jgi:hypothetical protein
LSFEAGDLTDSVVALHRCLTATGIPHAFGGALAAGHYGAPRETDDIDVNLFVAPTEWPRVREALAPLGVEVNIAEAELEREGQVRLAWEQAPLHLFFSVDPLHLEMERKARTIPYAGDTIPLVSPEHLVARKRLLGRPKDERDVERILEATPVDQAEVEEWVVRLGAERIRVD